MHDRLVEELELVTVQPVAELGLELEPCRQTFLHVASEHRELIPAGALRFVHRDVGLAQNLVRVVGSVEARDSDARGDGHPPAGECDRLRHRVEESPRDLRGAFEARAPKEHCELVAAKARAKVLGPGRRADPIRDRHQ